MPQIFKLFLTHITLGTCILFPIGCADSNDQAEAWELQDEFPEMPLLPGVYEAEFEIINDGCEPSLSDIYNKVEGWPPPQTFVFYDSLNGGRHGIGISMFSWRDGEFANAIIFTDQNFVPYSKNLWLEEWPSLLPVFNHLTCSDSHLFSIPFLRRAEVSLIAPNTFEIVITNDWGEIQACVGEEAREVYKTLPQTDCSESYKTTYRLVEACILPCAPPLLGLEGGVIDGYRYLRFDPPPSCICN